jgi:hypothetical protein
MDRRVYVRLSRSEVEALVRLASQERRHPADQGAVLLSESLKRAGLLSPAAPPARVEALDGAR